MNQKPVVLEKQNLHPRNLHRSRYDFKALIGSNPQLGPFVAVNQYRNESIDFANPAAVKALNKAILKHFYKINDWDIPAGYLCPPIPGRADYIHYLADLLAGDTAKLPKGANIVGLDIGVGANCVYPIIGHQSYGWRFVGSDIDKKAIASAQRIVDLNTTLKPFIECRLQQDTSHIFKGIVESSDRFDFTMCNPPFHASLAEATAGTKRKLTNLGLNKKAQKVDLNFGGQQSELWCVGGEKTFISKMIEQSVEMGGQCLWFTSLVSKSATLPVLYQVLKRVKAVEVKTIEMSQGQKQSRFIAWTFLSAEQQQAWKRAVGPSRK